jgi:glycosyltransferase involved in cell wall biosynthesis
MKANTCDNSVNAKGRSVHLIESISTTSGGLYYSVSGLVRALIEAGVQASVMTLDGQSETSKEPWQSCNVTVYPSVSMGVLRISVPLTTALTSTDRNVVHVHHIWRYISCAARWAAKRKDCVVVVSARGMLAPQALRINAWRKQIASCVFERWNLESAHCLHALTETEADDFRAYGLRNPIAVIPNGVTIPPVLAEHHEADREPKTLLYMGRLHPIKGLEELFRGWQLKEAYMRAAGWRLKVVGWGDGDYVTELQTMIKRLGIAASVDLEGPRYGEAKEQELRRASAFVLPSRSEAMSMALLEAWSYGLPVLMTRTCNLIDGARHAAAILMDCDAASIEQALLRLADTDSQTRRTMGVAGRQFVSTRYAWPVVAQSMAQVYQWLRVGGVTPPSVRMH